eukprot:scaffold115156_cov24-Tisochrysis_lutea.AAC.2
MLWYRRAEAVVRPSAARAVGTRCLRVAVEERLDLRMHGLQCPHGTLDVARRTGTAPARFAVGEDACDERRLVPAPVLMHHCLAQDFVILQVWLLCPVAQLREKRWAEDGGELGARDRAHFAHLARLDRRGVTLAGAVKRALTKIVRGTQVSGNERHWPL